MRWVDGSPRTARLSTGDLVYICTRAKNKMNGKQDQEREIWRGEERRGIQWGDVERRQVPVQCAMMSGQDARYEICYDREKRQESEQDGWREREQEREWEQQREQEWEQQRVQERDLGFLVWRFW